MSDHSKAHALRDQFSCLNKARPNEPIFVLRANDPLFAQVVRLWATMAVDIHEPGKIDDAMYCAQVGDVWRADQPVVPQPTLAGLGGTNNANAQDQQSKEKAYRDRSNTARHY